MFLVTTAPVADAFDTVSRLYPDKIVVQISTDGLCTVGGTILATQQQPKTQT
ncbi:hypothetical protein ACFPJ1_24615 [Kribbella qitaiheensis]|uniref:hypothetical protein n=1 Tax=Kribbella qitaiheensis TaxID=1544730 RepID=UPI003621CECE